MRTDREQAIAEIVSSVREDDYDGEFGLSHSSAARLVAAARKLADLEDPPLPPEEEVLVSWSEEELDGSQWVAAYGLKSNPSHGDHLYRCRITPLERVR